MSTRSLSVHPVSDPRLPAPTARRRTWTNLLQIPTSPQPRVISLTQPKHSTVTQTTTNPLLFNIYPAATCRTPFCITENPWPTLPENSVERARAATNVAVAKSSATKPNLHVEIAFVAAKSVCTASQYSLWRMNCTRTHPTRRRAQRASPHPRSDTSSTRSPPTSCPSSALATNSLPPRRFR